MLDVDALSQDNVGIIDLRDKTAFEARHIRQSLHIAGIPGLVHRFSWLPPPKTADKAGLPLLAICSQKDEPELRRRLKRWNLIAVIDQDDESFWTRAEEQGRIVTPGQQQDEPAILFQPSAVVELAVQECEGGRKSSTCTVLDLGCGAARDIAWIVRRESKVTWLATGLDNLHATLQRATLLQEDLRLCKADGSRIERLVWAQATERGTLEALQIGATSKSKGVAIASSHQDDSLPSFAAAHLPHATFDLILLVRFLPRPLLRNLPSLSHAGTTIAISHFTTLKGEPDYPSPDSSKRFEARDAIVLLQQWGEDKWRIQRQAIHRAEDGRPLLSVLFVRVL